jgi:hypothetical protein
MNSQHVNCKHRALIYCKKSNKRDVYTFVIQNQNRVNKYVIHTRGVQLF